MAWDTIGQFEEGGEPALLHLAEKGEVGEAVGTTERGTHRNGEDIFEFVEAGALETGVIHSGERGERSSLEAGSGAFRSGIHGKYTENGTAIELFMPAIITRPI